MLDETRNPWQTLSSREVYRNPWIRVREDQVLNPAGGPGIYGVVHFQNQATGIVALDNEGCLYLVGQYRYALDCYSWEIPEGGAPLGEDPLAGAQRELREECGLEAGRWEKILTMHLSNSVCDEIAHVYLATDLRQGLAEPEEVEQLQVRRVPLAEALADVLAGRITDSMSVAGILYAAWHPQPPAQP